MNLNSKVQAILSRTEYATATVDEDGNPWNAPVYVAYDDHFNFYWGSYKESQHSKNIRNNPKVFLTMYNFYREARHRRRNIRSSHVQRANRPSGRCLCAQTYPETTRPHSILEARTIPKVQYP